MVWVCSICGYEYNENYEKTPFTELADDWHCPICNAPKSAFQKA
ncbi:MAG TPA: rubredoxin [Syntrophorhabdaceae bacterium]|nr:rubredoxin [Syntrophorhabdaceae bacterium]HOL05035.1 rubredoxin [Syntrophorhabdaceae bacterium]HON85385.1 rubredoxin [Syntrophorhabdaceae bacterium]HOT41619.1 rubredoxin [Syntrophorhabdaceae bacterium]HPC66966.1 rubredoxin [Syntrophorhabdaceae bacterium]